MLYYKLKISVTVCLVWLRIKFTPSLLKNFSLCKTERILAMISLKI